MNRPSPSSELRAAADKLRSLVNALPVNKWGNRPWHAEECSDTDGFDSCLCIVAQGEYRKWDKPQDPPVQYVADAETVEHAAYIAAMHPGVGAAVATWLDRKAHIAAEVEQFLGDEFQDGALDHDVHDALAVARQILGTAEQVGRAA